MEYKLIVTDMDGTLLNSKGEVSEENVSALKELRDRGIHVAIATGRIYTTARVYAKHLGLLTPIICCNGAMVKNLENDKEIYTNPMSKEDCLKVIDICREHGLYFHFYSDDTIYGEKLENKMLYFSEWGKTLDEEDRIKIELVKDSKEVIERETIYKFGIQDDNVELLNRIANVINSTLDVEAHKSLSNMLDIMNKGVTKGKAIENLASSLGVKQEEIIAIGDNENDLSMITYAGLGVAMGNAEEKVKAASDYITDTNDNHGVAKVVKKFML